MFVINKKIKWIGEILLIIVIVYAIRAYQQQDVPTGLAPDLQGYTLKGERIALSSLQGQKVLVHFWATWCPICEQERDSINSINQDYSVISIAMQSGLSEEVHAYVEHTDIQFPVVVDENAVLAAQYGVSAVPASFVINTQGEIQFVEIGFTTEIGFRTRLWLAD